MRAAAALALLVAVPACGDDGGPSTGGPDARPDGFDRAALIRRIGEYLQPTYDTFATESAALVTAIEADCTAEAAQQAWRDAIEVWQRADAVLIGPAAAEMKAQRDRIYAWPLASTCAVDQDVVARWMDPSGFDVGTRLNNRRSLAAVEYLLFAATLDHTCPSQSAPPGWDAMSDADKQAARCGLAGAIAADVAAQAELARDGLGPYVDGLVAAGDQEAVNVISDALFYVDKMVKDMKLGEAAGIAVNSCATVQEPCLAEVEHRHADHATPALRQNLVAIRAAFTGTIDGADGTGFDDFLIAVGAEDVSTRMVGELDAAIAAVDAIDASYLTALESDYDDVAAAHAAIKLFTDDLKSQFLTVLGLDIPDDVAADND